SGWKEEEKSYDPTSWLYEGSLPPRHQTSQASSGDAEGGHAQQGANVMPDLNRYEKDETLQHPRCVYQLLKKHFARYTPEMVAEFCGVSKDAFLNVAKIVTSASG